MSKYWVHLLKVLSEPGNLMESADYDSFNEIQWWVGANPFNTLSVDCDDRRLVEWLAKHYVDNLTAFVQAQIEQWYEAVALAQHKPDAVHFAEKHVPGHIPLLIWELFPNAREVILVRDFRDMVLSIRAFNQKRGYAGFGLKDGEDEEAYIGRLGDAATSLLRSWKARADRALLVKYEDLVREPAECVERIFAYLDVDASKKAIRRAVEASYQQTAHLQGHRTTADINLSIGRWRREADFAFLRLCDDAFGEALEAFGYERGD
jgi:hypothetical protein